MKKITKAVVADKWGHGPYSILSLERKCKVCEKDLIISTQSTKKERAERKYCSMACKKASSRIRYDFMPTKKKDPYDDES